MIHVKYVLDHQYTGVVICRTGEWVQVQWDDGRKMMHHASEVEPYTPERKED